MAVECEGDADDLAVPAGELQRVRAPAHVRAARRHVAVMFARPPSPGMAFEGFDTLTSFTCFYCLPRASQAMRFQGLKPVRSQPTKASTCLMCQCLPGASEP